MNLIEGQKNRTKNNHSPLLRAAEETAFTYRGLRHEREKYQFVPNQTEVWDKVTQRVNAIPQGENLGRFVSRVRDITTVADIKSGEDPTLRTRAERLFSGVELPDSRGFLADVLIARAGADTRNLRDLSEQIKDEVGFTRLRKPSLTGLVMDVFIGTIKTPARKQEPLEKAA